MEHALQDNMPTARDCAGRGHVPIDLALKAAEIGIWEWDLTTNKMDYSPRAREIFGFAANESIDLERVRSTTHPEDQPRTSAQARRALDPAIREREPYEYRIIRADNGETRWVLAYGEAIFENVDGAPKAVRYIGTVQDITRRKAAENTMRENETRLRLAIDASKMAIWEVDLATEIVSHSRNLNRIFGFPDDYSPTLAELRERYAPGERERVQIAGRLALEEGRNDFEVEYECVRLDGQRRWLLLRAEFIANSEGNLERVIGVLADIDERKRAADQQRLIVKELNHRIKNTLAVVQSIVSQTFREEDIEPSSMQKCRERIHALARANDALVKGNWSFSDLATLIANITEPFNDDADSAIEIAGPPIQLPFAMNAPLGMGLHELGTNALKYGALSRKTGRVSISWRWTGDNTLTIEWKESGGPEVKPPSRTGFGSRLLQQGLSDQLGDIRLDYRPDGVVCHIDLILPSRQPGSASKQLSAS